MENRYNTFKQNENKTWEHKFVWRGLYGNAPKVSISISNFNKQTSALSDFEGVTCVDEFYKKAQKIAKQYIKWVRENDNIYSDCEYRDMYNSFVGCMGEYFFTYLLNEVRCLYLKENGRMSRYDFNYVAPLLIGEKDFGIDLTGIVNDTNCVIQVKFWNPFSDELLTTDILQKAYAEGVLNEHINPKEKKNVVICWLGDESKISRHIRDNEKLKEHIIFVDKQTLNQNIDNRNTTFWNNLVKNLSSLGTLA